MKVYSLLRETEYADGTSVSTSMQLFSRELLAQRAAAGHDEAITALCRCFVASEEGPIMQLSQFLHSLGIKGITHRVLEVDVTDQATSELLLDA